MLYPMLAKQTEATSLTDFIQDDLWVMEQKLDGHRILLCSPGGDFPPVAMTRNGSPYTRKLPDAIRNFRFPADEKNAPHTWILDGELVDGTFYVFDIPQSPYTRITHTLRERRQVLEAVMTTMHTPFKLIPQAQTVEQKIALSERALKENYEGLVIKRRHSTYISGGRTDDWLKLKFTKTIDVIVLDVRDDGKESVRLGIIRDGQVIDVGRASLIGKEKRGVISQGDVLEIMYLYCNKPEAPRLYQPTILRRRDDKRPNECTDDQLQFTNKSVLQSL